MEINQEFMLIIYVCAGIIISIFIDKIINLLKVETSKLLSNRKQYLHLHLSHNML